MLEVFYYSQKKKKKKFYKMLAVQWKQPYATAITTTPAKVSLKNLLRKANCYLRLKSDFKTKITSSKIVIAKFHTTVFQYQDHEWRFSSNFFNSIKKEEKICFQNSIWWTPSIVLLKKKRKKKGSETTNAANWIMKVIWTTTCKYQRLKRTAILTLIHKKKN